jgi:hypothetical protein
VDNTSRFSIVSGSRGGSGKTRDLFDFQCVDM